MVQIYIHTHTHTDVHITQGYIIATVYTYKTAFTSKCVPTYVCYFTQQTNTFQCVLATSATESFVLFLYADGRIQRGSSALAGLNAGDGINYKTVPGSRTSSIATISRTTNVGIPGIWMFEVDGGIVYMLTAQT